MHRMESRKRKKRPATVGLNCSVYVVLCAGATPLETAATACDSEPELALLLLPKYLYTACRLLLQQYLPPTQLRPATTAYTPPMPVFDPSSPIHRFRSVQHPLKFCSGFRVTAPLSPSLCDEPGPFHSGLAGGYSDGLLRARFMPKGTADEIKQVAPAPPTLCHFLSFLPSSKSFLQNLPSPPTSLYSSLSSSLSLPLSLSYSLANKTKRLF